MKKKMNFFQWYLKDGYKGYSLPFIIFGFLWYSVFKYREDLVGHPIIVYVMIAMSLGVGSFLLVLHMFHSFKLRR